MFPYARSKIKREAAKRNSGKKAKRARANKGTTASFPLTGDVPALRKGRPVSPDSILVS